MNNTRKTKSLLIEHCRAYPKAQLQDIFKYIYQSAYGCEHMITSLEAVTERIKKEYESSPRNHQPVVSLDSDFCRVPLSVLDTGISPETLGRLFFLSAKKEVGKTDALLEKLKASRELIAEKKLPFGLEDFDMALSKWEGTGFQSISHSEAFRNEYSPSYRVIAKEYVPYLPLFAELDRRLRKSDVRLALEGGSAVGKTTLASTLSSIYDCNVFHMDDFFLQPHQRTPERFAEAGGNVDRERFIAEVLEPLNNGKTVRYRKFDCSEMKLGDYTEVEKKRLTVIEGAYSMHPEMADSYDLSVLLTVPEDIQRERIKKRNTPEMAKRFFNEWIPMEEKYFSELGIKEKCGMVICTE